MEAGTVPRRDAGDPETLPTADGGLQVIRRADWRFLLPDPDLGRVAYVAPRDPKLFAALQLVSASVDRAPASELDGHDVVVVTGGGRPATARTARQVPPGAWLVSEVAGREARSVVAGLRRRGFSDVEAHWLWPDAERCREIVPLRPVAVRHALARRDPGGRIRPRVRLARLLARTPLFALVVERTVIVAKAPA
jgi:hypothetical protein